MATLLRTPPSIAYGNVTRSPEHAAMRRKDQDIAELVTRSQLLNQEVDRERAGRLEVEKRLEKKDRGWKEANEAIQMQYQTVQLQYRLALSDERVREMNDRHAMLQMKIAQTIRDHKISRFQARETELTWEIQDLTEEADQEREEAAARLDATVEELEMVQHDLGKKLARAEKQRDASLQEVEDVKQNAQEAETALEHLRVQHSTLDAAHRKTSLSLQRLQLEVDTLKAQEKDWKTRAADWQSLEKKSDKELDKLVEAKQALEGKVRDLEKEAQEMRKKERAIDKERKKMTAMEEKIERLETLLEKAQDKTSVAQQEAHDAQTELGRVQKQLTKLQAQVAREMSVAPGGSHKPPSSTTAVVMDVSPSPEPAPEPPRPKAVHKPRKVAPKTVVEREPSPDSDAESDVSEGKKSFYSTIPGKDKPTSKKPSSKGSSAAGVKRTASRTEKAKPREKPIPEEDEKENEDAPSASAPAARKAPQQPTEEEEGQKKKKRKLFGGAAGAAPFQWAAGMNTGDGVDSIIPSILSPIKGGGPAPQRAGVRALGLTSGRIF